MTLNQTIRNIERDSDKSKEGFLTGLGRGKKVPIIQALSFYAMSLGGGLVGGCMTPNTVYAQPIVEYTQPGNKISTEDSIINDIIVKNNINTPKDLEAYVLKNFRAEPDKIDSLKSIDRFDRERRGDCDEYSVYISKMLKAMGYHSEVLQVYFKSNIDNGKGHNIAIFLDSTTKKWYYLNGYDNTAKDDGRIKGPFNDIDQIVVDIFYRYEGTGTQSEKPWHGPPEDVINVYIREGKYIP